MIRKPLLLSAAGLLVAIAACDQSTGPAGQISVAEANQLASDMDAVATLGSADVGFGSSFSINASGGAAAASSSSTFTNQFSVTRQCPQGGSVAIAGTATGSGDAATHSFSLEVVATRTDANCAFRTRNGTLTVNGNPNLAYDGKLNIVNGALSGLQTQTHKGSFTWARTGGSGTCDVDIASSFDPATHTVTITGTFCGRAVNVTRTRTS
jgi:hypothetical protein